MTYAGNDRVKDVLYRHPAYREANLGIQPSDAAGLPWNVVRNEEVVARFQDVGKACTYLAFMRGAAIEPRLFR